MGEAAEAYLGIDESLVGQVRHHPEDELYDLVGGETGDDVLHHAAQIHLVYRDEGVEVDVGEEAHDELAIHAVRHAAVARD